MKGRYRIIAGLLGYVCLATAITMVLIEKKQQSRLSQDTIETSSPLGIDLHGMYQTNAIQWETVSLLSDTEEGTYYQISGLKKKEVEQIVNQKLQDSFERVLHYLPEEEMFYSRVNQSVYANYGNVISVVTTGYYEKKETSEFGVHKDAEFREAINLSLVDGADLVFEDLFTPDADIDMIFHQVLYEDLAWCEPNDYWETGKGLVYEIDENELSRQMRLLKKSDKTNFWFGTSWIQLDAGFAILQIDMEPFASQIAIYNRFLTEESIYETDAFAQSLFTLVEHSVDPSVVVADTIGFQRENLWEDIQLLNYYGEDSNEVIRQKQAEMKEKMEEQQQAMQNMAEANPQKQVVWITCVSLVPIYVVDNRYLLAVEQKSYQYEMDVSYFQDFFQDQLAESYRQAYRDDMGQIFRIPLEEGAPVEMTTTITTEYWNQTTGERVEGLEDLFEEGYDYQQMLKLHLNQLWNHTFGVLLTEEELQQQWEQTELEFDFAQADRIAIYNPTLGYEVLENGERVTTNVIWLSDLETEHIKL